MAFNITTYILAKKYTDATLEGMGSLQGKSAYEIAVENGFKGSEQEWLDSLSGATPYIGDNGNWFLDGIDTGVTASPDLQNYYNNNNLVPLTTQEILEICKT